MGANRWLLTVHVASLIVWLGGLLVVSRIVVHALRQEDVARASLTALCRKLYFRMCVPAGAVAILTGLCMLHGLFTGMKPGDALGSYFKPRVDDAPTFWYVTFHVKMVSVAMLFAADLYLGRQVSRMARGIEPATGIGLGVLAGFITTMCVLLPVWLVAGNLELPKPRTIGFAVAVPSGIAAAIAAIRLGKAGKGLPMLHGLIAAIMLVILVVILARPLAGGVPV